MRRLVDDVEDGLTGPPLLALMGVMVLPDACGKIEFPKYQPGERYRKWYNAWVAHRRIKGSMYPDEGPVDPKLFGGAQAWKVRNGLLHAMDLSNPTAGYDRLQFTPPTQKNTGFHRACHMRIMTEHDYVTATNISFLSIDVRLFAEEIIAGVRGWLAVAEQDPGKRTKLDKLIQYRSFAPSGRSIMPVLA